MSFLSSLLKQYSSAVEKSQTHPLTNELCRGTLLDAKLWVYLTQDLKFFQRGMNVFGRTLAYCDDANASITLAKQIGFVANDENDYFEKALKELKDSAAKSVPKMVNDPTLILPQVQIYLNLLDEMAYKCTSYVEIITFMYVMEFVYLGWANYNLQHEDVNMDNLPYRYKEWIVLHSGPEFTNWVNFLENEVNRVTFGADKDTLQLCENMFIKAVNLEIDFFDACYQYRE